jgi:antitoxin Phd
MRSSWQVQEAKNRFSEMIEQALTVGPQLVTRHGKPVVKLVAVSEQEAQGLSMDDGFTAHLLKAPRIGDLSLPPRRSRRKPVDFGVV